MTSKDRSLAAIRGQKVDRIPIFPLLMHFSADRLGVSYREFASNGAAMAEAQLKALSLFGLDVITACSDAFRISADLGGDIVYPEDKPPHISKPLVKTKADLDRLKRPDAAKSAGRMADRAKGVAGMVKGAGKDCLVLGWVDMPFAEACSLCGVSEFMEIIVEDEALAHAILDFLTPIVIDFALLQLEAGAPMIGAGDAAASLISAKMYRDFALPYEKRVCQAIHDKNALVKLHICGNTSALLKDMATCGADLFNVDHMVDLAQAASVYSPAGKCFKGNLDPVADLLQGTPESVEKKALACLETARGKAYMLSAGCEVPAAVKDEVFRAFCGAPGKFKTT